MPFTKTNLINLVQLAVQHSASDIHIRSGEVPCLRIRGDLVPVQTNPLSADDMKEVSKIILHKKELVEKISTLTEYDGGFAIPGLCRIRFNFFRFNRKIGLILRIVKETIPTLDSLGLPKVLKHIAQQQRGLVLVTGATGSGKSTTLAGMIDYINTNRACHIITVEDPVEYLHPQKTARISQREIGKDTKDFASALRGALRQDPDVILIGEMRDVETVQIALKAAETGHIVFSTVHTTDAVTSIGRLISMFPPEEQIEVRKRLAENLYATISQRMLKNSDSTGVVIAQEIMVTSPGIKECIKGEESISRIPQIIREGRGKGGNGSQSFDQNIMELYEKGTITKETALGAVSSQSDFMQSLIVD